MRKAKPTIDERIAVVYGRVSSDDQAGNASTRGQINEAEEFCRKHELILQHTYFDEARSGKSMKGRPELERMRVDARAGKFQHLVVWKLTRLSRSLIDTLAIIEELDQLGIKFHSITEPDYDTSTSTGRMILRLMATVAEFEREETVENVRMGMKQKAKEGFWSGGQIFGYRMADVNIASEMEKKGKLIIVPEEAAIVKSIFQQYAEGKGLKRIATQLNKAGYSTKGGNLFTPQQVRLILINPIYAGTIRFRTHDRFVHEQEEILVTDAHEAIVNMEQWEKVQGLRAIASQWPPHSSQAGFPLSSVLRCPKCGSGMIVISATGTRKDGSKRIFTYYACGRWVKLGKSACQANLLRTEEAEKVVLRRLKRIVTMPNFLNDIMIQINGSKQDNVPSQAELFASIEKKRALLKKKRANLIALFDGDTPDLMLKEDIAQVTADLYKLDEEETALNGVNGETGNMSYLSVKMIMDDFVNNFYQVDIDRQRALLRVMLKEITFNKEKGPKSIQLHFNDAVDKVIAMSTAAAG
ncbi:MAG: recombinase family protein [bacterium]